MLLWRHKERHKLYVWAKLVALSVAVHSIVILYLCFIYDSASSAYHMTIGDTPSHATVVFLPLQKRVQQKKQSASVASRAAQERSAAPVKKVAALPATKKEKAGVKVTSRTMTKTKKKTQTVAKKEKSSAKKELIKDPAAAPALPKKEVAKVNELPQPAPLLFEKTQPAISSQALASIVHDETILYVGRIDMEVMKIQEQICNEIAKRWKPPRGLARNMMCDIKVVVGWNGKADRVTIDKASGVLAYDVHARSAVQSMEFPKNSWGKELVLHFKQ